MKKFFTALMLCMISIFISGQNLVLNPTFNGLENWTTSYQNNGDTAKYVMLATGNGLNITTGTTKPDGRVDIVQDVSVVPGNTYTLSFDYTATHAKFRLWSFYVGDNGGWVYVNDGEAKDDQFRTNNSYFTVSDTVKHIELEFTVPAVDTLNVFRLQYRVYKQASASYSLNNVSVVNASPATDLNIENVTTLPTTYKTVRNGQVVIIHNGVRYNTLGSKIQ